VPFLMLEHSGRRYTIRGVLLLLLAACTPTRSQGQTPTCSGQRCNKYCVLWEAKPGPINKMHISGMIGINLEACDSHECIQNLASFTEQNMCLALGYDAKKGVTYGDQEVKIRELNRDFQCSNTTLHLEAKSVEKIVQFYNEHLEIPECITVNDTLVCGFGSRKQVGWANHQVQQCTENKKRVLVFMPNQTLHGVAMNLKENDRLFQIDTLLGEHVKQNFLLMVPQENLKAVVRVLQWLKVKDAPDDSFNLQQLGLIYKELCPQNSLLHAAVPCNEMTPHMVQLCKKNLDEHGKQELLNFEICTRDHITVDAALQDTVLTGYILNACKLTKERPTMPDKVRACFENKKPTNATRATSFISWIFSWFKIKNFELGSLVPEPLEPWLIYPMGIILEKYFHLFCLACLLQSLKWLLWVPRLASQAFSYVGALWAYLSNLSNDASEVEEAGSDAFFTWPNVCRKFIWPFKTVLEWFFFCVNALKYVFHKLKGIKKHQQEIPKNVHVVHASEKPILGVQRCLPQNINSGHVLERSTKYVEGPKEQSNQRLERSMKYVEGPKEQSNQRLEPSNQKLADFRVRIANAITESKLRTEQMGQKNASAAEGGNPFKGAW